MTTPPVEDRELEITALAAGGDGVGRDADGRVTFVPRTAPGDRVRARIVHATRSFARAALVELVAPSPDRVTPPCAHFVAGCGGCQWQHVALPGQHAAKQAIVEGALRKLPGLVVHPIAAPAPALGWRRRARFHVAGGVLGLFAAGSHDLVPIGRLAGDPVRRCPQLEPALDAALDAVALASPPDGELALVRGHAGAIAIATERPWRGAARLVGRAGIVGVLAGTDAHGEVVIEVEPGLWGGPWDFAQASAAGNAALIAAARAALGAGPGRVIELYAGAGNLTRALRADGWDVHPSDTTAPPRPPPGFERAAARDVLARATPPVDPTGEGPRPAGEAGVVPTPRRRGPPVDPTGEGPRPAGEAGVVPTPRRRGPPVDAVVLDPPRAGAADAIDGLVRLAPPRIVYVSCDPATLGRDAQRLVAAGYRATDAWPIDVMPQTAHVETVLRLVR